MYAVCGPVPLTKDQDAAGDMVTAISLLIELSGENMSHFFTERLQELHQQSCKNLEKLWSRKAALSKAGGPLLPTGMQGLSRAI
jgi:hypothetical protein